MEKEKTSSLKRMNHIEWFVMICMSGKGKNFITKEDESCIMVCDDMYVWKRKNFITKEDESCIMVCNDMYVWKRENFITEEDESYITVVVYLVLHHIILYML